VQIGGHEFSLGSHIDLRRASDGTPHLDYPHLRFDNTRNLKLNKYGAGPFVTLTLTPPPPKEQGVYAVVADSTQAMYIGQAANTIRQRWAMGAAKISPRNCFDGGQPTNCHLNTLIHRAVADGSHLELYVLVTPDYDSIERELIATLQPPWNIRGIR